MSPESLQLMGTLLTEDQLTSIAIHIMEKLSLARRIEVADSVFKTMAECDELIALWRQNEPR